MTAYIYCLKQTKTYHTHIYNRSFHNKWINLYLDGRLIIKGLYKNGYAWDGCTPKWKILDIYIGVPEGAINYQTGQSKTYYASLVHDIFYQFSGDIKTIITKKEVDQEFYRILKQDGFKLAKLYYWMVRLFGRGKW